MSKFAYRSSQPDSWIMPRPHRDAHLRRQHYGPIQPMEREQSFLVRLLLAS